MRANMPADNDPGRAEQGHLVRRRADEIIYHAEKALGVEPGGS